MLPICCIFVYMEYFVSDILSWHSIANQILFTWSYVHKHHLNLNLEQQIILVLLGCFLSILQLVFAGLGRLFDRQWLVNEAPSLQRHVTFRRHKREKIHSWLVNRHNFLQHEVPGFGVKRAFAKSSSFLFLYCACIFSFYKIKKI